jgi:phosphoenolpyruvate synthase/pyruvate phosphate dikinase
VCVAVVSLASIFFPRSSFQKKFRSTEPEFLTRDNAYTGFAISVNAMKLFYEHNRIDIATQTATEFELLNASNSFPESLRTAISDRVAELTAGHPDQLFAIRSSAVDEDGEDNALAGLLESFLNVRADDVLQSVIKCWASSASQRAAAYRSFHGIDKAVQDPEGSLMGVVVQKMAAPISMAFTSSYSKTKVI